MGQIGLMMDCIKLVSLFPLEFSKQQEHVRIQIQVNYEVNEWRIKSYANKMSGFFCHNDIHSMSNETLYVVIQDVYI